MTRAARRATTVLLATLTAALLSLALFAGPALAADDAEEDHGEETTSADEELSGFGTGQWDGLVLAAGAGLIVGALGFAMSRPGEIDRVADHH